MGSFVHCRTIHQGGPDKGLRFCFADRQRSDPLNLIQFILA
jgi:hypothetical protein